MLLKRSVLPLVIMLSMVSCQRFDSITRFSMDNEMEQEYYIYPSTLRMINVEENEDFNQMVEDFRKGQLFVIKINEENDKLVEKLRKDISKEGYEEAMSFDSPSQQALVYVLDEKVPKMAAIMQSDSLYRIFQVEGLINIAKLPKVMQSFDSDDYLNVLEVIKYEEDEEWGEGGTQD